MRDLETINAALTIAETGHLVFATLHTVDAIQTINRIIDVFPAFSSVRLNTLPSTNCNCAEQASVMAKKKHRKVFM